MFVRIDNTPRDYAWGSTTAIAELFGRAASGGPEAELWLGAHPASPSRILDPSQTGGARDLAEWIARDPHAALGIQAAAAGAGAPRLPYLMKVLAAEGPLSLQAHPSSEQAREGFARENAAGVPLDAPERNYKDAFHKPELLYALSDRFEALCGFRQVADALADVERLVDAADPGSSALVAFRNRLAVRADAEQVLRNVVAWLLESAAGVAELVAETVAAAARVVQQAGEASDEPATRPFVTVGTLSAAFPNDPGIVLSLLLHRVTLRRGEALYLPAGNIHAYLHGLGVELMASSDNVLRGGLTRKHIDIAELMRVLHFTPLPVPYLAAESKLGDIEIFRPDVPDFQLVHVERGVEERGAGQHGAGQHGCRQNGAGQNGAGQLRADEDAPEIQLVGPAIALCVAGAVRLQSPGGQVELQRGETVYVTPDEASIAVVGDGSVFIATENI
jgi:mannose-6-phosphate isomerase